MRYTEVMTKTINTHITALLSGATTILAVIHPGFHINPAVQGVVASLTALAAAAIEALHFVKTHNLQANIAAADHVVASLIAQQNTAPATPAPTTPAA